MKKFLLGVLTATLVFSLSISALAITGRMTIEVDPINIQVNGETFVPKDVNGAEVPVFAYNGTTYAPLRALAEAYGLEVGYDATANMATVSDPSANAAPAEDTKTTFDADLSVEDEAAYQEFKEICANIKPSYKNDGNWNCYLPVGTNMGDVLNEAEQHGFIERLASELQANGNVTYINFYDGAGVAKTYSINPPTPHEH